MMQLLVLTLCWVKGRAKNRIQVSAAWSCSGCPASFLQSAARRGFADPAASKFWDSQILL